MCVKAVLQTPPVFSGVLSPSRSAQTLDRRVALSARPGGNVTSHFFNTVFSANTTLK